MASNFGVGQPVKVWSGHYEQWVEGKVVNMSDDAVDVEYNMQKLVPCAEIGKQIRTPGGGYSTSSGETTPALQQEVELWSNHYKQWFNGRVIYLHSDGSIDVQFSIRKRIPLDMIDKLIRPCGTRGSEPLPLATIGRPLARLATAPVFSGDIQELETKWVCGSKACTDGGTGARKNLHCYGYTEPGWFMLGHLAGPGSDVVADTEDTANLLVVREGPLVRQAEDYQCVWRHGKHAVFVPTCSDPDFVALGVVCHFGAPGEPAAEPPVALVHKSLCRPCAPSDFEWQWSDSGSGAHYDLTLVSAVGTRTMWPSIATMVGAMPPMLTLASAASLKESMSFRALYGELCAKLESVTSSDEVLSGAMDVLVQWQFLHNIGGAALVLDHVEANSIEGGNIDSWPLTASSLQSLLSYPASFLQMFQTSGGVRTSQDKSDNVCEDRDAQSVRWKAAAGLLVHLVSMLDSSILDGCSWQGRLAVAVALTFCNGTRDSFKYYADKQVIEPVSRFRTFLEWAEVVSAKDYSLGFLDSFRSLTAWEMRHVVATWCKDEEFVWARSPLNPVRKQAEGKGDLFLHIAHAAVDLIPRKDFNEEGVSVHSDDFYGGRPETLEELLNSGGVCGAISKFSAGMCQAFGIPATPVGQPGHCAFLWQKRVRQNGADRVDWQVGYDVGGWSKTTRHYDTILAWGDRGWLVPLMQRCQETGDAYQQSEILRVYSEFQQESVKGMKNNANATLLAKATTICPWNYGAWRCRIAALRDDDSTEKAALKDSIGQLLARHLSSRLLMVREGPLVRQAEDYQCVWRNDKYAVFVPTCSDPDFVALGVVCLFGAADTTKLPPETKVAVVHKSVCRPCEAVELQEVWSDSGTGAKHDLTLVNVAGTHLMWPSVATMIGTPSVAHTLEGADAVESKWSNGTRLGTDAGSGARKDLHYYGAAESGWFMLGHVAGPGSHDVDNYENIIMIMIEDLHAQIDDTSKRDRCARWKC